MLIDTELKSEINYGINLTKLKPDVLIKPKIVWEIAYDSFTVSPIYKAGEETLGEGKGISLRFPKFRRERDDKGVEQANTTEEIVSLYQSLQVK